MSRIAPFTILISALIFTAQAVADELSRSSTEAEIVEALNLPEGPVTRSAGTYLIQDGVIYKLIRGKRFRPRCMVKEMEEVLPRVGVPALFDVGSINPKHVYLPLLHRLGNGLMARSLVNYRIRIVGHTDGTGSEGYNLGLSRKRALWVKQYLEKQCGVAPERLTAEGLGVGQPIESNETARGRARNRRVEFEVTGVSSRTFPKPCGLDSGSE
jgi:hypothetical protein